MKLTDDFLKNIALLIQRPERSTATASRYTCWSKFRVSTGEWITALRGIDLLAEVGKKNPPSRVLSGFFCA
jgi:hypothetical protein